MDIYKTLLLFALVCALAAFFVMWAKWEEQKVKTREAEERRWDEISRAAGLENIIEDRTKDVLFLNREAQRFFEEAFEREVERDRLQYRLSSLLCPRNDHVWKDGCCVKCGRVQE